MKRGGRGTIVAFLIASLVGAAATRQWGLIQRQRGPGTGLRADRATLIGAGSRDDLESMDTYALALLLGGLRGPLVMFLWYSSENQKDEHNLADFDTKVEWIRLLQPEFDTVHLFEIWNKAYNISVQMSSLPNKYSTILDALDYAHSVDAQKPDDINIISAIGGLYSDKLGTSNESGYYISRVCAETQPIPELTRVTVPTIHLPQLMSAAHRDGMDLPWIDIRNDLRTRASEVVMKRAVADKIKDSPLAAQLSLKFEQIPRAVIAGDQAPGVRRTRLDPMLDANGDILPEYLQPTHPRPPNVNPDDWYDGSELQFLKQYEPFPYGMSPEALGYNYHRRAQLLMNLDGQHHIQTSDMVIDSRPALTLKFWGDYEGTDARRAELRLFGLDDRGAKLLIQLRAPDADPSQHLSALTAPIVDPAAADRALFEYNRAVLLYHNARIALINHTHRFPDTLGRYNSHIDDTYAFEQLYGGDRDFLHGVLHPDTRQADWDKATAEYRLAIQDFDIIILRYYSMDEVDATVFPINPKTHYTYTHDEIADMPVDQRTPVLQKLLDAEKIYLSIPGNYDGNADSRNENLTYIARCGARLIAMGHPTPFPQRPPGFPND